MLPLPPSLPLRQPRPQKELVTAWLLVLLHDGPTHGYKLCRALRTRRLDIDASAVYRQLRKLEDDGWISSRWMRPLAGPRRRVYRLTRAGERELDELAARIVAVRDFHDEFVEAHEQVCRRRKEGRRGE